jgi:hypothetical protein
MERPGIQNLSIDVIADINTCVATDINVDPIDLGGDFINLAIKWSNETESEFAIDLHAADKLIPHVATKEDTPLKRLIPAAAVLVAALTACATQHAPSSHAAAHPHTAAASASAGPATSPAAQAKARGNISLSGQARYLPAGPFRITPVYCGKFTAAQQNQYGTNAAGGLVYEYANMSNSLTAAPNLSANFLDGGTVAGNNVTGAPTTISPGQNATGEIDAVGGSGQNLTFTSCELMDYGLITEGSGAAPGTYAP